MLKKGVCFKVGVVCAAMVGMTQATLISTNSSQFFSTGDIKYDTHWQDIKSVTCAWDDVNNNKIVEVGEQVKFTVTMEKNNWGTHNYDALKTWIDNAPTIAAPYLDTKTFTWDYNKTLPYGINNYTDSRLSYKPWTGGTKSFDIFYTFNQAGLYDFGASVMCSADLSDLTGPKKQDNPSQADWNAWGPLQQRFQGETEFWRLKVSNNVPEPSSISLMFLGLTSLAGAFFIRRKK